MSTTQEHPVYDQLRTRMVLMGITQERLALTFGVNNSLLSRYLRGMRQLPVGFEARVHAALDRLEAAERAANEARERVMAEAE